MIRTPLPRLFLALAACDRRPLVCLQGDKEACESVERWITHACIDAEDRELPAPRYPIDVDSLDDIERGDDLILMRPSDLAFALREAAATKRFDLFVVDVGESAPPARKLPTDVKHLWVEEDDVPWFKAGDLIERALA